MDATSEKTISQSPDSNDGVLSGTRPHRNPQLPTILNAVVTVATLTGGIFLILVAAGFFAVNYEDAMNKVLHLTNDDEIVLLTILGLALCATPFWAIPRIRMMKAQTERIKLAVNHHLRNEIQAVVLSLELIEMELSTAAASPSSLSNGIGHAGSEGAELIRIAKQSCDKLIFSLDRVLDEHDGVDL